jgi:hypothetical protein
MADKLTWGGSRKNSGRKKATDPKKQVSFYLHQSLIERHKGEEALKNKVEKYLKRTA